MILVEGGADLTSYPIWHGMKLIRKFLSRTHPFPDSGIVPGLYLDNILILEYLAAVIQGLIKKPLSGGEMRIFALL
jgi:hypothetical protein